MKVVYVSDQLPDAELVVSRLCGAGFNAALRHGGALGMMPSTTSVLTVQVVVPDEEEAQVAEYLRNSEVVREGPVPAETGIQAGSVCPVHEEAAVAVCERCGTFLCAKCGALGNPPVCEDCLAKPEQRRSLPGWVRNTVYVWLTLTIVLPLVYLLLSLLVRALR